MTLDLAKIKSDAEKVAANSDLLLMALPVKDVQEMVFQIEDLRVKIKEMDRLFGRHILGNKSAVIEWTDGQGAEKAMEWIWNGLMGPGLLPPDEEKDAQGYFNREVEAIEKDLEECYAYWDRRREDKKS